ncbi:MAG: hypothetical protein DDT26_02759 [Dehalococcoidia bacterium]|nr:hypothetical protein [Chloroflexota bacterium]
MAIGDELWHIAEEEGKQQGTNMRAINIGIGHDDDAVIAKLGKIELRTITGSDTCPQSNDEGTDFIVRHHLLRANLLHIEDLSLEWQYGLEASISSLLGRTTGRISLDNIKLTVSR